jgi:hypothetical protein
MNGTVVDVLVGTDPRQRPRHVGYFIYGNTFVWYVKENCNLLMFSD